MVYHEIHQYVTHPYSSSSHSGEKELSRAGILEVWSGRESERYVLKKKKKGFLGLFYIVYVTAVTSLTADLRGTAVQKDTLSDFVEATCDRKRRRWVGNSRYWN